MRVLITGARGQVGTELKGAFASRGHSVEALPREVLDVNDRGKLTSVMLAFAPQLVINTAAYTAVDRAEREPDLAFRVNAEGARNVAEHAASAGAALIHFSTDYVFDGAASKPYDEWTSPSPVNTYGASKLAGEEWVRTVIPRHLIIRTSWVFAAHGQNFVRSVLEAMVGKRPLKVVDDQVGSPTPAGALADEIAELTPRILADAFTGWGTYHLCGSPPISRYALALAVRAALPDPPPFVIPPIHPVRSADRPTQARRPGFSALAPDRARKILGFDPPNWKIALPEVVRRLLDTLGNYSVADGANRHR